MIDAANDILVRPDGIASMVPDELMGPLARKWRDNFIIKPDAPFFQREFGFFSLDRWYSEGLPRNADLDAIFGFDKPARADVWGLGWCEAQFYPLFEEKVIEDRGDHEVAVDFSGRHVLYFKGRRNGFMPEYLDHPVKDIASWEEKCLWRMDPATPRRYADLAPQIEDAKRGAARGFFICQRLAGGYMYLRSLIGPGELLYKVCEDPELIHACMRAWFSLADAIIARNQKSVTFDEIFFAEDICYNHGPLISPDMMHEYLFPYYQQLIANMKARQIDRSRHLYVEVDTDGWCTPIIDVYREAIGMDVLSPFEVASGCDVVEIGARYPELIMSGGVDKRVLAKGKEAIDRHVDRIFPAMRKRGGYMPTCDHGVPAEVSLENYMHYRKRCREFA